MVFKENLKSIIDNLGISPAELSRMTNIPKSAISEWLSGKRKPSFDALEQIAKTTKVSLDWLILDKEETNQIIEKYSSLNEEESNQIKIPFFPEVFASAGNGNIVHSENKLEIKIEQDLLKNIGINSFNNLSFIKVKGDSMEPLIKEEDILICRKDKNPIKNGKLYVVRVDDKLFVKEVHLDLKNNIVSLVSKNTAYSPIVVNLNTEQSFSIRAVVLGSISFNQFKL